MPQKYYLSITLGRPDKTNTQIIFRLTSLIQASTKAKKDWRTVSFSPSIFKTKVKLGEKSNLEKGTDPRTTKNKPEVRESLEK